MASPGPSKAGASFAQIYDTLPPDAQRSLLESYLVPLLDDLPDAVSTKVIDTAKEMQTRFMTIPKLDYFAKRTELEGLLGDIERDQKQSQYIKGRSTREKLFEETIDSLSTWVNDIWSVIYEYQTNFRLAHQCLLLAAETLGRMYTSYRGCNCAFVNLRFSTKIRSHKTGKIIKTFHIVGVPNFERILLWTWRDLFVSMLASSPKQGHAIPDMLQDIQAVLNWEHLLIMVLGKTNTIGSDESDDDLESDTDDGYAEEFSTEDYPDHFWEDSSSLSPFHADHWPKSANFPINDFRDLIQQSLVTHFQMAPSLELYRGIASISTDLPTVRRSLLETAESNALWSTESFAAALNIFAYEDSAEVIWKLHERGSHLLRPCHALEYQNAVLTLADKSAFKSHALKICQDQLLTIGRELRAELCLPFSRLYDAARVAELEAILKQQSISRRGNIESWVTAISTPAPSHPNPMAFAAMMMGLPIPLAGGELGGVEEMNMFDLEKDPDPDLDDLREEFRPQFKSRLEGWFGTTLEIGKPDQVFRTVHDELLTMMPFLRDDEIIDEMLSRISDNPSKRHICDGLGMFHAFVKTEILKEQAQREKRRRKGARAGRRRAMNPRQTSSSSQGTQATNSTSRTPAQRVNAGSSSMRMPAAGPL